MKRIWIGVVLLAVLLAAGLLTMELMTRHLETVAQNLQAAAGETAWETAVSLTEDAQALWKRHQHFHAALADHGDIDVINSSFAQLEVYAQHSDLLSHRATCAWLAQTVKDLAENHRLTWWNLL